MSRRKKPSMPGKQVQITMPSWTFRDKSMQIKKSLKSIEEQKTLMMIGSRFV